MRKDERGRAISKEKFKEKKSKKCNSFDKIQKDF